MVPRSEFFINGILRLIGRLFLSIATARNQVFMQHFENDGLVVIGTWLITKSPFTFCNVINYEMQGLELVTPLQEVFAGAGDI